jgi:outer membrane protein assembly factor BamB
VLADRELLAVKRALALLALLAACKGPPREFTNKCAPGWPAPTAPAPAAPLAGVTPGILWRTPLTLGVTNDWILVGPEKIALTAGARLYLLDKQGNYLGGRTSAAFEGVSSAVVDDEGNYYFVGQNAYSTDADGTLRWLVPLDGARADAPGAGRSSALSPAGVMIVGASDGALYGISTADGARVWRREVAQEGERAPVVKAGIGGAVIAVTRGKDGAARPQLFDAATGEPLAWWASDEGERHGVFAAPALGIVTQRMEDKGGPYPWMHVSVLDECSREKWTIPAARPQWPVLVGPGDRLFMVERDDETGSATFVSVYDPAGARVLGPVAAAPPWALGADGTVYGLECDSEGHDGPSRLIAYDGATLGETWRLELGASCPSAGPVIDAEGRLYFTWFIDGATEVVAVQTTSPGLATDAAWPARGRDVRGTRWVK